MGCWGLGGVREWKFYNQRTNKERAKEYTLQRLEQRQKRREFQPFRGGKINPLIIPLKVSLVSFNKDLDIPVLAEKLKDSLQLLPPTGRASASEGKLWNLGKCLAWLTMEHIEGPHSFQSHCTPSIGWSKPFPILCNLSLLFSVLLPGPDIVHRS